MRRILVISLALLVIVVLAVASLAFIFPYFNNNQQRQSPDFHVGVTFSGNTTQEAKMLVDRVKNFTNLFVVQSGPR